MKDFFLKFKIIDLFIGLLIYLLLLFIFGWGTPDAFNSYSKNYNYGFPGPIVVKSVPTDFCPHPPCEERLVSYHFYDSYANISSLFIFSIVVDFVTLLLIGTGVSFTRRRLLKKTIKV